MGWPFGDLRPMGYGAILADPPWAYAMRSEKGYAKSPEAHYATMADEDILALPVGDLAQRDCLLVLWAVWPKLPLAVECVRAWGFRHVTGGAWIKRARNGGLRMGTGYTMRSASEPFIIARNGDPQARLTSLTNVIEAEPRGHSRKPAEMRAIVEAMTPQAFRCELFAREAWPGNDVWGNEATKFDGAA